MATTETGYSPGKGSSEQGMVLVMVLILSAISMVLMAALLLMVTNSTQMSGGQKRYASAGEAAEAGSRVARQMLDIQGSPAVGAMLTGFNLLASARMSAVVDTSGLPVSCLRAKLENDTALWSGSCDATTLINETVPATYDMTFTMGANPTYTIYAKIVDTVLGNTEGNPAVEKSTGVVNSTPEIPVSPIPTLYTTKIVAVANTGTQERSVIDLVYGY